MGLIEKMLSYALVMQRYVERLVARLQEDWTDDRLARNQRARSTPDLMGKAAGAQPTADAGGVSGAACGLAANEAREFEGLRSTFGQHVRAFLTLMAQLSHVASASTSFRLLLTQCNFNTYYNSGASA
jgi:hypothetical protein